MPALPVNTAYAGLKCPPAPAIPHFPAHDFVRDMVAYFIKCQMKGNMISGAQTGLLELRLPV
jgi:hypothetical protein